MIGPVLISGTSPLAKALADNLEKDGIHHAVACSLNDEKVNAAFHRFGKFRTIYHFDPPTEGHERIGRTMTIDAALAAIAASRRHHDTKVVYVSSAAVYASSRTPLREVEAMEAPANPKGLTQRMVECAVLGSGGVVLRFFEVFGAGFPSAIETFTDPLSQAFRLEEDGHRRHRTPCPRKWAAIRDFLPLRDAIDALRMAQEVTAAVAINVGSGVPTSIEEIMRLVNERQKSDPRAIPDSVPDDPRMCVYANLGRIDWHMPGWRRGRRDVKRALCEALDQALS